MILKAVFILLLLLALTVRAQLAADAVFYGLEAASPSRDFGIDVSHFQNEGGIPQSTWNQLFAEGKRFVFVKATEGLTGPHDPTMSNNVARA